MKRGEITNKIIGICEILTDKQLEYVFNWLKTFLKTDKYKELDSPEIKIGWGMDTSSYEPNNYHWMQDNK